MFQNSEVAVQYPGWALAILASLIIFAMLPVPLGFIYTLIRDRKRACSGGVPADDYTIVSTKCETALTDMSDVSQWKRV